MKKKYLIILLIMMSITVLFGTSYALLRTTDIGTNTYVMKVGLLEVSFLDSETNALNITNMVPMSDSDGINQSDELEFIVKNTGSINAKYDIYIEETSSNNFKKVIKYIVNKNNTGYGDSVLLNDNNYIEKESILKIGEEASYKVKLWLVNEVESEYMNKTFTAKIVVSSTQYIEKLTEDILIETAVSYSVASDSSFSGGLVAINTDGELYDETDSTEEIREYRYTGLDVNNYIFLDTNGNGEQDENEMWRIIGIFKNSNDEWNLKLMRNTLLTADEIPEKYIYNEISYTIRAYNLIIDGESVPAAHVFWNKSNTATNYNDWTTAKLQYWLNGSDGYYGTLSNSIQNIIDTDYKYYLGNWTYSTDTTILSYTAERNVSNIWSGNSSSWNGSIALLYPSDYGYSANGSYWGGTILNDYNSAAYLTSWMQQNANHTTYEWLLSPESDYSSGVAFWNTEGYVYSTNTYISFYFVRPVINLIANFGSLQGSGTESDPYTLV